MELFTALLTTALTLLFIWLALETLSLRETQVTATGVREFRKTRPEVEIHR